MVRSALAVSFVALILNSVGCGPPAVKLPPSAPVKGTVTLDGQPMAKGEVYFNLQGQPVKTIPVTDGAFAGEAFVGQNKVEIHSFKDAPATSGLATDTAAKVDQVADEFTSQSKLTADVASGGANEFKFDAKSK